MINIDVVCLICASLDACFPPLPQRPRENLITFVADRPAHDARYAIDASKIERELGWKSKETFETGPREDRRLVSRQLQLVGARAGGVYRGERLGTSMQGR